jgi:gamma-glutamyltranspeptidase/glutathione hydrolase
LQRPDLRRPSRASRTGAGRLYEGKTAELIEAEMKRGGGLITRADLKAYQPKMRVPLRGLYRGYDVLAMPPISSGGTALLEMLNILEGYDLKAKGFGSADTVHLMAEAMRVPSPIGALFGTGGNPGAHRAAHLHDYARTLRATIDEKKASSSPSSFEWPAESHR